MIINKKYDVNRGLESAEMNILESGFAKIDEKWHYDNVLSIYSRLYYISEGEGAVIIGNAESLKMLPGHIYLIPSGYRYSCRCDGSVKKVYFHISIKRDDGYDAFSTFGRFGEIDAPEMVEQVCEQYENEACFNAFALKSLLFKTVAMMAEKYDFDPAKKKKDVHSPVIRTAEEFIQNNLSMKLTRRAIAKFCRVSEGKLANCFKNELGVSVAKYIDDLIFMEAMRRLSYTDDPLWSISDDLGFSDQFYFSRRFNELYGESPLKYRKKMQNSR